MRLIFPFLLIITICSQLCAQQLDIVFDVSAGSGAQTAIGATRTEWNHTPVFTDYEIMFNTDKDPLFEFGLSLNVPVEDRMGLGIVPKVKLKKALPEGFEVYGTLGIPLYVAGYKLYGVSLEGGFKKNIKKFFYVFTEAQVAVYPLGDDLVRPDGKNGMIAQFNLALGISFMF